MKRIGWIFGLSITMMIAALIAIPQSGVAVTAPRVASSTYDSLPAQNVWSIWGNATEIYTCGTSVDCQGSDSLALLKWDLNGNLLWNTTWPGSYGESYGKGIWGDNQFVYTTGSTWANGSLNTLLIKWDSSGDIIWSHTWSDGYGDEGNSIWGDGNYLYVCGYTGVNNADFSLLKWDLNGNLIWNSTWGGNLQDIGLGVQGNGTAIFTCGRTYSYGAGNADAALVCWNLNGTVLWNATSGGTQFDSANALCITGSNIYMCGRTWSFGAGSADLQLSKWNVNGTLEWNQTWGTSDYEAGFSIWSNGSVLDTCGYSNHSAGNGYNLLLVQWDTNGNMIWNQTWNEYDDYLGTGVWGFNSSIYTVGWVDDWSIDYTGMVLVSWSDQGIINWQDVWGTSCVENTVPTNPGPIPSPYPQPMPFIPIGIGISIICLIFGVLCMIGKKIASPRPQMSVVQNITETRSSAPPVSDHDVDLTIPQFCSNCGAHHAPEDRYCAQCGHQLQPSV